MCIAANRARGAVKRSQAGVMAREYAKARRRGISATLHARRLTMRGIARYGQLFSFAFLVAVLVAACGDRTPLDVDLLPGVAGDDGGTGDDGPTLPPGCGNGVCN